MTEQKRQEKNKAIGAARKATSEKRLSQECHTYLCKIQHNRLATRQKESIYMSFVEEKWIYNDAINWLNEDPDHKLKDYCIPDTILHYDKDKNPVLTELKYAHSQVKQQVITKISSSLKSLNRLKAKGHKVGKLRFISDVKVAHYPQCSKTMKQLKFRNNQYVKIPGIPGNVRVNGLDQFVNIPGIEIACFELIKRPDGLFIAFTTYCPKRQKQHTKKGTIGIDFGCSNSFTMSDGSTKDFKVEETDRLKRLQKKLSYKQGYKKGEKKSNKFKKLSRAIEREYQKMTNKKQALANEFVHNICEYEHVVIQDENLTEWHKTHGVAVQHSILGRVKSKLIEEPNVTVLNKYAPTTQLCTNCMKKHTEMKDLSNRIFKCDCGVEEDRDIHAAKTMVWMYEHNIGVGRTESNKFGFKLCFDQTDSSYKYVLTDVDKELAAKREDSTL